MHIVSADLFPRVEEAWLALPPQAPVSPLQVDVAPLSRGRGTSPGIGQVFDEEPAIILGVVTLHSVQWSVKSKRIFVN